MPDIVLKKLGKMPVKRDARNLKAARYLASTFPASYDWQKNRTPVPSRTFGNDSYGDCTVASQANCISRFERREQRRTILIPDQTVIANYLEMTGGADDGWYELDALKRWRTKGVRASSTRSYTIDGFTEVNPRSIEEMKAAIWQFKLMKVCFSLPVAWSQIEPPGFGGGRPEGAWGTGVGPDYEPGSWGGHCIAGSTPIALLRGEDVPVADLVGERDLWVYGSASDGAFVPAKATEVVKSGTKSTLRVVLDDGTALRVTPDHQFLLRDGTYRMAKELVVGTSLMPLYRRVNADGYEETLVNDEWAPTHRLVANYLGFNRGRGWVTHHVDINKRNNEPNNLNNLTWLAHRKLHAERSWAETYNRTEQGRAKSRELMESLWANPEWRERMLTEIRPWEKVRNPSGFFKTEAGHQFLRSRRNGDEQPCATCGEPVYRPPALTQRRRFCSRDCTAEWTRTIGRDEFRDALTRSWTADRKAAASERAAARRNHKVVAVEAGKEEPVYDLVGVDPTSNFAAGGVYVHNSMMTDRYDANGIWVVHTWWMAPTPVRQLVTWEAVRQYCDEAYGVVDSFDIWRQRVALFDVNSLQNDVKTVTDE